MYDLEEEIISALYTIGIPLNEFVILPEHSAYEVVEKVKKRFVEKGTNMWWTALKSVAFVLDCSDESAPHIIHQYIPEHDEFIFLIPSVTGVYTPVFQIKKNWIPLLLLECSFFEYYLVSMLYDWLIVETHHGQLIGSGELSITKMAPQLPQQD